MFDPRKKILKELVEKLKTDTGRKNIFYNQSFGTGSQIILKIYAGGQSDFTHNDWTVFRFQAHIQEATEEKLMDAAWEINRMITDLSDYTGFTYRLHYVESDGVGISLKEKGLFWTTINFEMTIILEE